MCVSLCEVVFETGNFIREMCLLESNMIILRLNERLELCFRFKFHDLSCLYVLKDSEIVIPLFCSSYLRQLQGSVLRLHVIDMVAV